MVERSAEPGPNRPGTRTGMPRWVKAASIIAVVVIALFVVALVFGGGQHGPSRHSDGLGVPGSPVSANVAR